ncbi:hypothetical protein C5S31_06920 [ANME-1 cluster archaeon GoMg2]|nr:hypothetical protein [ANME-1 cluster archaeon GoMg2]
MILFIAFLFWQLIRAGFSNFPTLSCELTVQTLPSARSAVGLPRMAVVAARAIRDAASCQQTTSIPQIPTRKQYYGSCLRTLLALYPLLTQKSCVNLVKSRGFLPRCYTNTIEVIHYAQLKTVIMFSFPHKPFLKKKSFTKRTHTFLSLM